MTVEQLGALITAIGALGITAGVIINALFQGRKQLDDSTIEKAKERREDRISDQAQNDQSLDRAYKENERLEVRNKLLEQQRNTCEEEKHALKLKLNDLENLRDVKQELKDTKQAIEDTKPT